jgi:hypothetical protein
MDLQNWPVSHALDDVASVCSFDDDASIDAVAGSPAAAQLLKHDERMPLVDAYAFVDDAKAARKASRSKKSSSCASKQQQIVPSTTVAAVAVAAPSKPLKWQVGCAGCSYVPGYKPYVDVHKGYRRAAPIDAICGKCRNTSLIAARLS